MTKSAHVCESWKGIFAALVSGLLTVVVHAQPTITLQPTNEVVAQGGTATFSVAVSGTGPFTYQWQCNGTNISPGIIRTVAGTGINGFSGDGGAATNAQLSDPYDVVVDERGRLFIADDINQRIRMVDTNGVIRTVAGNGQFGNSGDGYPATNASFGDIQNLAMDTSGNLFLSDDVYGVIRKVDTNGIITTAVGGGFYFNLGICVDTYGDFFVADGGRQTPPITPGRIAKVNTNGVIITVAGFGSNYPGDGGLATNAAMAEPDAVAMNSAGELLIGEEGYVCKVDTNGILRTVAEIGLPTSVKVDASNNVFIADYGACCIHEVMAVNGTPAVVAGTGIVGYSGDGGPATSAKLNYPDAVALDSGGNLFIADFDNSRIREVTGLPPYPVNLPTFLVANASGTNNGNYSVVVTGSGGSVTSSVASLTVVFQPTVSSMGVNADGSFTLNLVTMTNMASRVYVATGLCPPVVWVPVYTNLNGGSWQFTDTNTGGVASKNYRVSTP
jgi:hypothetical protein